MAFQQGLSGLNVSARSLDVIGNNIANASTVGFKFTNAQFADVYATTLTGARQIGIGAMINETVQQFGQGNIASSSNPLDLAINGNGFFRMLNSSLETTYTRNGQFLLDKDGYVTDAVGNNLTGYGVDATYTIVPAQPSKIRIDTSDIAAKATAEIKIGLNLDSRQTRPTPVFSPTDPTSYNHSTSVTSYDSLGNSHTLSLYYKKITAVDANTDGDYTDTGDTPQNAWQLYTRLDGAAPASGMGTDANPAIVAFNSSGAMVTAPTATAAGVLTAPFTATGAAAAISQSFTLTGGATTPLAFNINMTGTTQYGNTFGVNSLSQDGYTAGKLAGLSIGKDGVIQGRYTNGQSRDNAQVVIVTFNNPNGLMSLGGNQWVATSDSGQPLVNEPGVGAGVLQSAAYEESNVDLTAELVNMIVQQRIYQANAQTIKTQDSVLQTLVNMR